MPLPNILLSFTTIINLSLAVVVYIQNRRSSINQSYAVFVLSISIWAFTNALFQITHSTGMAYFWAIVCYLAAIGIGASILYFSFVFPHGKLAKLGWAGRNFRKIIFWATLGISTLVIIPGGVLKDRHP